MQNNNIKINSNKSFGIVFFIVFLLISTFPLLNEGDIRIWSLIVSLIFLILGLLNSNILTPLNRIWFRFGILLGRFVAPIVMSVVFFFVVTPIALMMRLFNKNLLGLKKDNKNSYWINSSKIKSKMKDQF
tara:strand:+ start:289 stop:678 length:390 start_codon:yes stop_codon:yes gene_type:complete